jgi:uncharacterized protein YlxW (UPF0749 family)
MRTGGDSRKPVGAIAIAAVAVGFLLVVQVRTMQAVRPTPVIPVQRVEELAVLVGQAEQARAGLEGEVARLRQRLAEYERLTAEGKALTAALAEEAALYRVVLGLAPVRGPGIEVTVEAGRAVAIPIPVALEAIDLAGITNELWAGGAEAIAIGGRRVLARSAFRQSGGRVLVDGAPVRPPYVIRAIGPADEMEATLRVRGGFVDGLRAVGVTVRVERRQLLRLPAYTGPLVFKWAEPVP